MDKTTKWKFWSVDLCYFMFKLERKKVIRDLGLYSYRVEQINDV